MATAKDVSLAGLSLRGYTTKRDQRLKISIPLPGDREVIADCEVCRRRGNELGLKFRRLDWENFFALARYLYPRLP